MATNEIVYSQTMHPEVKEGRKFSNPRFFQGEAEEGVTKVIIVGDFPDIAAAYKAMGAEVVEVENEQRAADAAAVIASGEPLTEDQKRALPIPGDWQDLPWTQRGGASGLTLRALASSFSDEPVINKEQAEEAIHAELRRRGLEA